MTQPLTQVALSSCLKHVFPPPLLYVLTMQTQTLCTDKVDTDIIYTDNTNNMSWQCIHRHCILTIQLQTICTDKADTDTVYTGKTNNRYWQCRHRHCILAIETIGTDTADTDIVYWQYQQYVLTMQTKTLYNYINNANNLELSLGKCHSGSKETVSRHSSPWTLCPKQPNMLPKAVLLGFTGWTNQSSEMTVNMSSEMTVNMSHAGPITVLKNDNE